MNFVNNWKRPIVLGAADDSCPLDLPDGLYVLTLNNPGAAPSPFEVVHADVAAGVGALARGQEGTTATDWPSGSVIFCSVTAETLTSILSRLADLEARVSALEPIPATLQLRLEFSNWVYGSYPLITSVEAYSGGDLASTLDLSLFTQAAGQGGSDVSYTGSGVQVGYTNAIANIDTHAEIDPAWDELRITIIDSYDYGCTTTALESFDPEVVLGTDTTATNGAGGIDIVVYL